MASVKACLKLFAFFILVLLVIGLNGPLLWFYRGKYAYIIPWLWQCGVSAVFGIKVIREGTPVTGRQTLYVGNHLSYLDIPAIGSLVRASFVARGDLSGWPVFGLLSKMQQTAFISRDREKAVEGKAILEKLLCEGKSLLLFAEGTSTDGRAVLPFKSSLFALAFGGEADAGSWPPLTVQPVTIELLSVDGISAKNQEARDQYAWYGDMTLPDHIWAFAKGSGASLRIVFHPPRESADYTDRKLLAADSYKDVAWPLKTPLTIPLAQSA